MRSEVAREVGWAMSLARGKKAGADRAEMSATSSTESPMMAKMTGVRRVRGLLPRRVVAMPTTRVSKAGGRTYNRERAAISRSPREEQRSLRVRAMRKPILKLQVSTEAMPQADNHKELLQKCAG